MKIVDQHHVLETLLNREEILESIMRAGRTCYKSEPQGADASAFVQKLVKNGHHSVIEHVNLTVRFVTDRGVTHELVRHRLAAYSQESTRYCDYSGEMEVIRPVWQGEEKVGPWNSAHDVWFTAMKEAETSYILLREAGWSPQQARTVLPNSLKTEIVMTANLREWRHVLALRTSKAAHPQIRALMEPLQLELAAALPEIFGEA